MLGEQWRKSTTSHTNGCVEARWQKATACNNGNCVEVVIDDEGTVQVRDTDDPSVVVTVRPASWQAFLDGVRRGEFDLPAEAVADGAEPDRAAEFERARVARQAAARFDAASGESARLNGMVYP